MVFAIKLKRNVVLSIVLFTYVYNGGISVCYISMFDNMKRLHWGVKEIFNLFVVRDIVFIAGQFRFRQNVSLKEDAHWAFMAFHDRMSKYFQIQHLLQKTCSPRNSIYLPTFKNIVATYTNLKVLSSLIDVLFLKKGGLAIPNLYATYLK